MVVWTLQWNDSKTDLVELLRTMTSQDPSVWTTDYESKILGFVLRAARSWLGDYLLG